MNFRFVGIVARRGMRRVSEKVRQQARNFTTKYQNEQVIAPQWSKNQEVG
jgi:hypothetical protein